MRILLISPPDRTFNLKASLQSIPSLALCSLASNMGEVECETRVLDLMYKPKAINATVAEVLRDFDPHVVGLTTWTFQYESIRRLAALVGRHNRNIVTVLGGYHPTLTYESIGESEEAGLFDFIVRGEGEATFRQLVGKLQDKDYDFSEVLGLSWRQNGAFVHNPPGPLLDLGSIELPDRTARLVRPTKNRRRTVDLVETSRGCTLPCTFCCITKMYGQSFREFPIDRVLEDIRRAKANGAEAVFFVDDNITLNVPRIYELCEAITKAKLNGLRYYVQATSAGMASKPELAWAMKAAGFYSVFLGIESATEENLRLFKKGRIINHSIRAVKYSQEAGLKIFGGFIVGNPDDDAKVVRDQFRFARQIKVDYLALQIATPYPRTLYREELLAQGMVVNKDDFSKYNGFQCNVRTKHLSQKRLKRMVAWEYFKFTWWMMFNSTNLWTKPYLSLKNAKLAVGLALLSFSYLNGTWCRSDFHSFD